MVKILKLNLSKQGINLMNKVSYHINVAYKGKHDFTVVVDRNGPENTTKYHAKFVLGELRESLGLHYQLTLIEKTESIQTRTL